MRVIVSAILILAIFVQLFASSFPAGAANKQNDMELIDKAKSTSYYVTLQGCIEKNMPGTIEADSDNYGPTQINWFDDNSAYGYVFPDGKMDCKQVASIALKAWGVTGREFLAGIKYKQSVTGEYDWVGTGDGGTRKANFVSYAKSILGVDDPGNPGGAAAYYRYSQWWDSECVVDKFGRYDKITDAKLKERLKDGKYEVEPTGDQDAYVRWLRVARVDGIEWGYSYKSAYIGSNDVKYDYNFVAYGYHDTTRTVKCNDVAKSLTEYADDYATYVDKKAVENLCKAKGYVNVAASSSNPPGSYTYTACINGFENKKNPSYCTSNYPDSTMTYQGVTININRANERAACVFGAGISDDTLQSARDEVIAYESPDNSGDTGGGESSCGVEGIGWIVCPAISFMTGLVAAVFPAISDALKLDIGLFAPDSTTFDSWVIFRNFANVAFVIVFLIIIFSQMTGAGITNYGVKKMLPRLVVAAILVNTSYYICQIAVDLSNVLGVGLKQIFDGIAVTANVPTSTEASGNAGGIVLIGAGAIAAVGISLALGTLIPVLVGAVVALLGIVLVLILRKALVVILIVVAPLAFVAFLLPNTQSLFDKWRKLFTTLLLLFPIVSVVFGASSLASQILMSTANGNIGIQIAAFGAMTLPFFVVPTLLKGAIDAAGGIGGKINGMASKLGGGAGRLAQKGASTAYQRSNFAQARGLNKQIKQNYRAEKFAKRLGTSNALQAVAGGAIGGSEKRKYMKNAAQRVADDAVHSTRQKEIAAEQRRTAAMPHAQLQAELAKAVDSGDHNKARAIQNNMFRTKSGREAYKQTMAGLEKGDPRDKKTASARKAGITELKDNVLENHGDVGDKDNAIMEHALDRGKKGVGGQPDQEALHIDHHSEASDTYEKLSDNQIASHSASDIAAAAAATDSDGNRTLTAERAASILANDNINGGIKGDELQTLKEIAAGVAPDKLSHNRAVKAAKATEQGAQQAAAPAATVSSTAPDAASGAVAFPSNLSPTAVAPSSSAPTPAATAAPSAQSAAQEAQIASLPPALQSYARAIESAGGANAPTIKQANAAAASAPTPSAQDAQIASLPPALQNYARAINAAGGANAPTIKQANATAAAASAPVSIPVTTPRQATPPSITPAGSSDITNVTMTSVNTAGVPQNTATTSFVDVPMPKVTESSSQPIPESGTGSQQDWHEKEHEEGRRYQHADDELVIERASRREKRVAPKWLPISDDSRQAAESHNDRIRMAREEAERRGLNQ